LDSHVSKQENVFDFSDLNSRLNKEDDLQAMREFQRERRREILKEFKNNPIKLSY
jgi:hypothetical protein